MTIKEEGQKIAEQLGVRYAGPQYGGDEFEFHFFIDPVTGTSFSAKTLEEAKENLIEKRKAFGAR